jgi:hypothetical protein
MFNEENEGQIAVLPLTGVLGNLLRTLSKTTVNRAEEMYSHFRERVIGSIHVFKMRAGESPLSMLLAIDGNLLSVAATRVEVNPGGAPTSDYINMRLVQPVRVGDVIAAVDTGHTWSTIRSGYNEQLLATVERLFKIEGPTVVLNAGYLKKVLSSFDSDENVYIRLNEKGHDNHAVLVWGDSVHHALMPVAGLAVSPEKVTPPPVEWVEAYCKEGENV